ncbi:peptidoglycan DD-metalloendopeptidase family protein [Pseudoalteromonas sp. MMG010]|uniref:murein hydrolase activator EnvC family protein n=1 Tax=Pseudoalteromonas sp. MMG010 TaxID=2822685 RepID=UPI001B3A04F5|nr:peptidoglycan DD-metalloendopeptidase family protein [Pseudoalteromonas sp. MMG010]MBQ4834258.1 peptidoglycan DD-metalloendopeptidase family protein [Pseudoalteromonas sp. MMG010]
MYLRINRLTSFGLILISLAIAPAIANEDRTKKDLSEIQNAIEKNKAQYNAQQKSISTLQSELKSHELDIAKNAKALNMAKKSVTDTEKQQQQLQAKAKQLITQQQQFKSILASQLKSAYMAGDNDYAKMLLNQQNTAQLERTLSYYNFLNKARIEQLEELKALQQKITENQNKLDKTKAKLTALFEEQKRRQNALLTAQKQRKTNLKQLQTKLNKTQNSINYLKENEQTLLTTIEELEQQSVEQIELLGLTKSKGKLNWPTKGRLKHKFGQRKHAGIDWKGVLISADTGAKINSVQNGQVVFADWLKGFGWVIVIDHGEGYMSLYGHTQTLLKDVGDMVREGETVALVGQSGGQSSSGLYFEIRHKGRAVNPVSWCRRI